MGTPLRVLVVEDSADDAELMVLELRRGDFDPRWRRVETADALSDALTQEKWDIVLWDYTLPGLSPAAALALLQLTSDELPFIVVTGTIGEEKAVELIKAGVHDYVLKDHLARLAPAVVHALRDAGERRARLEAEERLRRSESLLAEAQQVAHIGSWNWNLLTSELLWSDEHYRIVGLRPQALPITASRAASYTHPDDLAMAWSHVNRALRDRQPYEWRLRIVREDGTIRVVQSRGQPEYDATGKAVRMHGTIQDVTERVQAEEALRVANERLDLAMRGSNIGIWDLDLPTGGDYRHVPVRFINVWEPLGYAPAEFPSDAAASRALGHPDDLVHVDAAVAACLAGEAEEIRVENRIRHKDGSYRWLLTLGKCMRGASGKPIRLIGTVLDITERKHAEEAMQRAKVTAERANRTKDDFLATVSHELRTPVATILLWSQLLEHRSLKAGDEAQAVRAIRQSAQSQRQLIEDLLDISRMLAGEIRLHAREVDLLSIVRAAIDVVRPVADDKGVNVEATLDPGQSRLWADSSRLQQVVLNLLNNAVKFTPAGGRVNVRLRRSGDALTVEVADTGEGIAKEFLPHVFERFRQADTSDARRYGGLGLGLAIARELVQLHGGSIRAESPGKGRGATFTVELPTSGPRRERGLADHPLPHAEDDWQFVPSPILNGVRVLIVEDDAPSREVLQYVLQRCEAEVTAVDSAADALQEFAAGLTGNRFDVLVSDIGLPEMSGYKLMLQIRALERQSDELRHTPAIALTAYAHHEDRSKALAAGFDQHLSKPIAAAALVRTVAECVGRSLPS